MISSVYSLPCSKNSIQPIPIEVKYKQNIDKNDIGGLLRFMVTHGSKKGIVVTKDTLKEENTEYGKISYVPAWLFLLTE